MNSPLDNLCGTNKSLAVELSDAAEFAGLKRSGLARLQDAGNSSLSLEGRFDLAYNAAHAMSLACVTLAWLPGGQSLYRVPGAAAYAWAWAGGLARIGEVP